MVLLVVPWVLVWALAPHHHLDATAVSILTAVSIPLAGLWLTWAAYRASKTAPADGGAQPGSITAGPGAVVAGPGGDRRRAGRSGGRARGDRDRAGRSGVSAAEAGGYWEAGPAG